MYILASYFYKNSIMKPALKFVFIYKKKIYYLSLKTTLFI